MVGRPTVFISYQRSSGKDLARYLHDWLTNIRVDTFLDVDDISGGLFGAIIEREIISRSHLLVILTPSTFGSDWVRKEIATALRHRKEIVPLMTDGFTFSEPIPADIEELANYSGIQYDYRNPRHAQDQIKKALGLKR